MLDASTAVGYLIARGGNAKLAAVDASRELNDGVTEARLLAVIASDPTSVTQLAQQARLLVTLQLLDAFRMTHTAYMQRLGNLTPRDTAKAYTDMAQALTALGGSSTAPKLPDPFDEVLKKLPPEVADSVQFFVTQASSSAQHPQDIPLSLTPPPSQAQAQEAGLAAPPNGALPHRS